MSLVIYGPALALNQGLFIKNHFFNTLILFKLVFEIN